MTSCDRRRSRPIREVRSRGRPAPMPTRPPSLRAVAAFEAAARHESFAKPADELNLSHSRISHAIRGLEQRLGSELFARVGRCVALTPEGARLAQRLSPTLTDLTSALD